MKGDAVSTSDEELISYEDFYAAHPIPNTPANRARKADANLSFDLAQLVYDLRTQAGLTQAQLARRMGTAQSVIARLESGSHNANLSLVNRVAQALGARIRFVVEPESLTA